MRTWKRAVYTLLCGAAQGCVIGKGQPYLEMGRDRWTVRRCMAHADEAVPAVIDGRPVQAPEPVSLRQLSVVFRRGGRQAIDNRKRQANDSDE